MTEHLSTEIVERFHQQMVGTDDRRFIYDHILNCEPCRQRIVDSQSEAVALQALLDHFLPANDNEPYHLDYHVIEAYVENRLDKVDRNTAELHLEVCGECSAEATDLRDSLKTLRAASFTQSANTQFIRERRPRLARLAALSTPLRISAIVAVAVFVVIAAVVAWRLKSDGPGQESAGGKDLKAESKPTPFQSSTPDSGVGSPPLRNTSPDPERLAESTPNQRLNKSLSEALVLNDGPNRVTLDNSGKLIGLEALPRESQQAVKVALLAQTVQKPDVLNELTRAEVSPRAPGGDEDSVRVVYPANTVIAEDKPILEWAHSKTAEAYRVEVGDSGFRQVAKSDDLPSTSRAWTPAVPLKRGMVYTWGVREVKTGKEGGSVSSTSQGKFKVLEDEKVKELNRLKTTSQSHLALGLFYAREGMIAEAEREFQTLVKENPRSPVARKLLREIQSWQIH